MKQSRFTILENNPLAGGMVRMTLSGDTSAIAAPGQFVNVRVPGWYLRRPISVCDWEDGRLTLLYKVVGSGTEELASTAPGGELDLLIGLGNGYDMEKSGRTPLLIGGGAGIPPLYGLCKRLLKEGKRPLALLGYNKAEEMYYVDEFKALGAEVVVATADGSFGVPGFVTQAIPAEGCSYFYACGPLPMLKAVCQAAATSGQISLEERMGCGFGACMGCTHQTRDGPKRVCADGPVFEKEALLW